MINIYIGYNMLEDTFYKLFQLNFACNVTNHFFILSTDSFLI